MILPLGHDELTLRRLPWVTLALGLLCVGVQVRAALVEHEARSAVERVRERLRALALEAAARQASPLRELSGARTTPPIRSRHDIVHFPSVLDDDLRERLASLRAELVVQQQAHPAQQMGYRPGRDGPLRMVLSAFAHGGWLHLIANLLLLYLVGCKLEARWGWWRFLAFYVGGAAAAALSFHGWHPAGDVSVVGASGAIAAVVGAFLVVFWKAPVRFAYWLGFTTGTFAVAAWLVLPLWLVAQAVLSWQEEAANLGVVYPALLAGALFGLSVALLARAVGRARERAAAPRRVEVAARSQKGASSATVSQQLDAAALRRETQVRGDDNVQRALGLLQQGRYADALAVLEGVLAEYPEHTAARSTALRVAEESRDLHAVVRHAGSAFAAWAKLEQHQLVAEAYRRIAASWLDTALDERALLQVLSSARALQDPALGLEAAGAFVEHYGESALLPRVLWLAAEAQEQQGRTEVSRNTLRSLVTRFPQDPLTALARKKLGAG